MANSSVSARGRQLFLAELARTSNVTASAKVAKVSLSRLYRLRRQDRSFAAAWFEALCEGYDHLEMELLGRLRGGELEGGKSALRATRRHDNAAALRLLAAHRASVDRQRARDEDEDEEAIYRSIDAKLQLMRRRADALPALLGRSDDGGASHDD